MPGRTLIGTSRRKRRIASKKKKLRYWVLAAAIILLVQALPLNRLWRSAARPPADAASAPVAPGLDDSANYRFWQLMLGANIPGFNAAFPADRRLVYGLMLDAFSSLTGVDPRDPRSFLERELKLAAPFTLPVFVPPGTPPAPAPDREPKPEPLPVVPRRDPSFFFPFPVQGYNDPVILLYHTHATESFYPTSGVYFSQNLDQTVVRLGDELARLLQESYGLPLIHDRSIYDLPRIQAYDKARPAVGKILGENTQVQLVVDLHRDGVAREITTTVLQGRETGKILLMVGTRYQGWETSYELALRLQQELEAVAPGLSRGIRRENFVYNQDLHPRSMLIEIGGHENTLEESLLAVPYLAEALARVYYLFFIGN